MIELDISPTDGLYEQTSNPSDLNPLTEEVISRQATINIGTIGHVAHGKSTLVRSLSGITTIKFKSEKERNITIKLGYANCKLYKRIEEKAGDQVSVAIDTGVIPPGNYTSKGSGHPDVFEDERGLWKCVRHVSFVDCPGHDVLMATMLNGTAIMDAALLLVAANESCPQPQTSEHLAAIDIMKLNKVLILQNKVELVTPAQAVQQQNDIRRFVAGSVAQNAPIIPISAVMELNLDVVAEYLCTQIPVPLRDFKSSPEMIIIRSFDINKPGVDVMKLSGGVIGGTVTNGVFRIGDILEIRPGLVRKILIDDFEFTPLRTKIISLNAEKTSLKFVVPGGLIGMGTILDPSLTRADQLIGNVVGYPHTLPGVLSCITIEYQLFRRLLGVNSTSTVGAMSVMATDNESNVVKGLVENDALMINVGSSSTSGKIVYVKSHVNKCKVKLFKPVCSRLGSKVAISRRHENHWRLIGYGKIVKGVECNVVENLTIDE